MTICAVTANNCTLGGYRRPADDLVTGEPDPHAGQYVYHARCNLVAYASQGGGPAVEVTGDDAAALRRRDFPWQPETDLAFDAGADGGPPPWPEVSAAQKAWLDEMQDNAARQWVGEEV